MSCWMTRAQIRKMKAAKVLSRNGADGPITSLTLLTWAFRTHAGCRRSVNRLFPAARVDEKAASRILIILLPVEPRLDDFVRLRRTLEDGRKKRRR